MVQIDVNGDKQHPRGPKAFDVICESTGRSLAEVLMDEGLPLDVLEEILGANRDQRPKVDFSEHSPVMCPQRPQSAWGMQSARVGATERRPSRVGAGVVPNPRCCARSGSSSRTRLP